MSTTTTAAVVTRAKGRGRAALVRATYALEAGAARRVEVLPELDTAREDILALGHTGTDVIVRGYVYPAHPGQTEAPFSVARAGHTVNRLDGVALGQRLARVSASGEVSFSAAEVITRVALAWRNAYGGTDAELDASLRREVDGYAALLDATDVPTLCDDARNPDGCGYCVLPPAEGVRSVRLPRIEWRDARLVPERFLVGDPDGWCQQVWPCGTEAVSPGWYPRAAAMGLCELPTELIAEMTAAQRCGLDVDYLTDGLEAVERLGPHPGFYRVAAPALQWSALQPGEAIVLEGLRPGGARLSVTLPPAPTMGAEGWSAVARAAVVELDAEAQTMTVLWVAEDAAAPLTTSEGYARWQEG